MSIPLYKLSHVLIFPASNASSSLARLSTGSVISHFLWGNTVFVGVLIWRAFVASEVMGPSYGVLKFSSSLGVGVVMSPFQLQLRVMTDSPQGA